MIPELDGTATPVIDTTVPSLRKTLTSESSPLAARFRALFSLKHLAALDPPTSQSIPAVEAIAAGFSSPSALLKHELAYCLGQSGKRAAIEPLKEVLRDRTEDPMCRHEAAEALGALGDMGSLELLRERRDDVDEVVVVKETCDLAVERIEWEHSEERKLEQLKQRYGWMDRSNGCLYSIANDPLQRLCFGRPCTADGAQKLAALDPGTRTDTPRHQA